MSALWLSFLALGFLGSAHCIGMCGGFAVAVGEQAGPGRAAALRGQLLYVFGKALTYATLGLMLSTLARLSALAGADALALRSVTIESLGQVLAWVAGLVMIFMGLAKLRSASASKPERWARTRALWRRFGASLQPLFSAARQIKGDLGALSTGLVTGLLPCGLSWGALVLALAVEPMAAFVGMLLFGLATAPALLAVGLGWRGFSLRFRTLAAGLTGPLLIVFGLYTGLRGAGLFGESLQAIAGPVQPACCAGLEEASVEHEQHLRTKGSPWDEN